MSTRVYLSPHTCHTPHEEETPVCLSIPRRRATVTALHSRLQHASQREEGRRVRRTTVWLALLGQPGPVEVRRARGGRSPSCLSPGRQAFLLRGMDRVVSHQSGGRRPQVPPRQHKRVGALREAGPQVVGCATAWGTSVLLGVLSWREGGVRSTCQDGWTLRHTVGFALHKARVVSDPRDAARRPAWLQAAWPLIRRTATRRQGRSLCEAEARVAQGGA
jgi:hypothetical protein